MALAASPTVTVRGAFTYGDNSNRAERAAANSETTLYFESGQIRAFVSPLPSAAVSLQSSLWALSFIPISAISMPLS